MKLKESEIKLILDSTFEKYKNESFLLSQSQIQELCNKKPSIWKGESYWNSLNRVLQKGKLKYEFLFGTVNGIVFCNITIPNGETYYSIIFYNNNPVSGLNVLRLYDLNEDFYIKTTTKQIRFIYSESSRSKFHISTGSGLYDYKSVEELYFPCDEKTSSFFDEFLNQFEEISTSKEQKIEDETIKKYFFNNVYSKYTFIITPNTLIFQANDITEAVIQLSEIREINLKEGLAKHKKYFQINIDYPLVHASFFDETLISKANEMIGLIKIIQKSQNKSKAEILKIINSKHVDKSSLINVFINEFDKNQDSVLDVLESKTFADILKSNQKQIIEKNPDYIHKFVKLSNYIKTKSDNLQKLFIRTKEYVENNDALLVDNSIKEVDFFKGMVHSYNLILFHSVNMITALISDDLITFYEIYESFDKLAVFNSNWENDVTQKLMNVENKLQNVIDSIKEMESQICMQLEILTNSVESSFDSLEESVNNQLSATNSLLGFNNLLTGIQTYQMYKINTNTKSLGK
ncbi:hypothetical protein [Mesoflavibacter zeaxanthinifaciens]|uniref:hypothetical protein n=1 Tax=Mesoflavibacter zeaxanthinifaciens TaxID=393060 RepID=UPI0026ECDB21|nr:hypothetical protein [Mesoflavibacter zeaxanthinifaciens]